MSKARRILEMLGDEVEKTLNDEVIDKAEPPQVSVSEIDALSQAVGMPIGDSGKQSTEWTLYGLKDGRVVAHKVFNGVVDKPGEGVIAQEVDAVIAVFSLKGYTYDSRKVTQVVGNYGPAGFGDHVLLYFRKVQ